MAKLELVTGPTGEVNAEERFQRIFDAAWEISELSRVVKKMVIDANLESLGKAMSGILVRIESLGESVCACTTDDPEDCYGLTAEQIQKLIYGDR